MIYWMEIVVAACVGFCAGVVLMGSLLRRVKDDDLDDRILRAMQEQTLREYERNYQPPTRTPPRTPPLHPRKD